MGYVPSKVRFCIFRQSLTRAKKYDQQFYPGANMPGRDSVGYIILHFQALNYCS